MCLILFAHKVHPNYPLVLAANRDEAYARPTAPASFWNDHPHIYGGRDLEQGGTWLGIARGGGIAAVTNFRGGNPAVESTRSRGELVTRWLQADGDAAGFVAALMAEPGDYGGFNLVLGDFRRNAWSWVTNKTGADSPEWQALSLKPGVYGLSNASLDTPWPKTIGLKRALEAALAAQSPAPNLEALQTPLWSALANRERAFGASLPTTGVSRLKEEALSSAFVDFPESAYGTRSSTLLVVGATNADSDSDAAAWEIKIEERTHDRGISANGLYAYERLEIAVALA